MNRKMKGNCVVSKLLFLITVYEFPLLLQCYLFNKYWLLNSIKMNWNILIIFIKCVPYTLEIEIKIFTI